MTAVENETDSAEPSGPTEAQASLAPVIEQSAGSARLVVVGGASFIDDFVLQLASQISEDRLLNNLLFIQNMVDWSVEDLDLLNIRSRGTYTRVLQPLEAQQQTTWEVVNYIIALVIPLAIYFFWRNKRLNEIPMELLPQNDKRANHKQEKTKELQNHPEEAA
jgi:ABC-2 type transport system permease protein